MVRHLGRSEKTSWLDVACGTGRHLEFLRQKYSVMGVDGSREMLQIARRRLPGIRLVLGDMRSFRVHRRFDVVSCLFSAIGHLPSDRDVRATFANFERHLNPGGIAIVEPWIEPSAFRPVDSSPGAPESRSRGRPMRRVVSSGKSLDYSLPLSRG